MARQQMTKHVTSPRQIAAAKSTSRLQKAKYSRAAAKTAGKAIDLVRDIDGERTRRHGGVQAPVFGRTNPKFASAMEQQ
jgi:hypothetical protein